MHDITILFYCLIALMWHRMQVYSAVVPDASYYAGMKQLRRGGSGYAKLDLHSY